MNRIQKQIQFIAEIDKLKSIYRQSFIIDGSRHENDAEHTWHFAMMSIVLLEHVDHIGIDLLRTLKMVLLHDIVEIDAGDTFAYDVKGYEDKEDREQAAAKRIFGLLPIDQGAEFYDLWVEFELQLTNEAKYAAAIDRLQPLIQNYYTKGASWKKHSITKEMVLKRNRKIKESSETLWNFVVELVEDSVIKGYLLP
ncbi:HD domain-containing protein [Cytobacillus sp. S13-E01]|uniref:HD domain-containing protein n=1 Tax=Cytobacillus sp. S13-E01 TaxID=3031326 RepID=UPI0023D8C60C|nr:HD domain-containing protein [Cytobacillus sp. S13-E01]MDF0725394.1 HD domain-containing protein [Cytobacillus sp. S13-E01]